MYKHIRIPTTRCIRFFCSPIMTISLIREYLEYTCFNEQYWTAPKRPASYKQEASARFSRPNHKRSHLMHALRYRPRASRDQATTDLKSCRCQYAADGLPEEPHRNGTQARWSRDSLCSQHSRLEATICANGCTRSGLGTSNTQSHATVFPS